VCPEPEQLAAYVDGRVTAEERAAIQRHLADCEDCREVVADAVRLRDESHIRVLPFWRRRKAQAIGGGILALAASLILVVQVRPELNPFRGPTPYEELIAASGTSRTIEARLAGGFPHASPRRATRSQQLAVPSAELRAAAARVEQHAARDSAPARQHELGVAQLVMGQYDRAVTTLEGARNRSNDDPRLLNDLAAAYLARARTYGTADDISRALSAADAALAVDPTLAEAWFNRALAFEYFSKRVEAAAAWRRYLEIDPTSPWSDEARWRLSSLRVDEIR
jgi:hypothetical protein